MSDNIGLCYRCENRARWFDTRGDWQPRCECAGDTNRAVYSCYMYKPTQPISLVADKGDKRPIMPDFNHFSGRAHYDDMANFILTYAIQGDGIVWYWKPKAKGIRLKLEKAIFSLKTAWQALIDLSRHIRYNIH